MSLVEVDLLEIHRGTVTAPAGCGKTELIAQALVNHKNRKPVLVLTHTNAGVAALRDRLDRAGAKRSAYRLSTLDGWALRVIGSFPSRSGHDPDILLCSKPDKDYPAIRQAAKKLLSAGHINDVVKSSYAHLIVDEYQDCSVAQHAIICLLSEFLPTCVLGDPLQAIFGFRGDQLANWDKEICVQFPITAELRTPWRWRNAQSEELGQWLLAVRETLIAGQKLDLRTSPPEHVTWLQTTPTTNHSQRIQAARTQPPTKDGRVLLIADSHNQASRHKIASQTYGAITVEAVDLQDLVTFCDSFDVTSPNALDQILKLAKSVMTNIAEKELTQRISSLRRGTARKPALEVEACALSLQETPSFSAAINLLLRLQNMTNVRVYRPAIFYGVLKALGASSHGTTTLSEAGRHIREESRLLGRRLPTRAVGSTLLLKGLEAEMAVILNAEGMNSQHLYVALTRGSMKLVVCSSNAMLG